MSLRTALFLITARAGSKRLPNKNTLLLDGVPLLAYKVGAVRRSRLGAESPIIISTDAPEYARIAAGYGVEAPFLRPKALATDRASSIDVVLHAMRCLEQQDRAADVIVLLEPSTPFLTPEDVDGCDAFLGRARTEAVVTFSPHKIPSRYIAPLAPGRRIGPLLAKLSNGARATHGAEYTPNGMLYLSRWEAFKRRRSFYHERTQAYITPAERSVEIDLPMDWLYAQAYAETPAWRSACQGALV